MRLSDRTQLDEVRSALMGRTGLMCLAAADAKKDRSVLIPILSHSNTGAISGSLEALLSAEVMAECVERHVVSWVTEAQGEPVEVQVTRQTDRQT